MAAMKVISRISELREREGITQRQLAELLGVTDNTVANWESGRSSVDWIDKVIKLCKIFNCLAEDLVNYEPDIESEKEDSLAEIRARLNPRKPVQSNPSNPDLTLDLRVR
ncbi:helix-turn-helix transcriptional regulator [uncultured Nostoc sp.]|uniref:helix-turn-helix transcriptional regulator n=1 Tax=uncultured Nostoc sp. TaxID=340711 RepID=UPI0035CB92FF